MRLLRISARAELLKTWMSPSTALPRMVIRPRLRSSWIFPFAVHRRLADDDASTGLDLDVTQHRRRRTTSSESRESEAHICT